TPITASRPIATRSPSPTAIRGPGPVRRSATAVTAAATPTPQAASRLDGFASRFDWVITPGQAMVMHRTTDAAEAPITARRAAGPGQHQTRLRHGEADADALACARADQRVRPVGARSGALTEESVGVETKRVGVEARVAVDDEGRHQHGGAGRDHVPADLLVA